MSLYYKRKSDRKLVFTYEVLDECKRRLENGESKRQIADSRGINEATLRKRLKAVSNFKVIIVVQFMTPNHVKDLDAIFYGVTRKQLMKLAFDFAEINISHNLNKQIKMAGRIGYMAFAKETN